MKTPLEGVLALILSNQDQTVRYCDHILLGLKHLHGDQSTIGSGLWVPVGARHRLPNIASSYTAVRYAVRNGFGIDIDQSHFQRAAILETFFGRGRLPVYWKTEVFVSAVFWKPAALIQFDSTKYQAVAWFPLKQLPEDEMLSGDVAWMNWLFIHGKEWACRVYYDNTGEHLLCHEADQASLSHLDFEITYNRRSQ